VFDIIIVYKRVVVGLELENILLLQYFHQRTKRIAWKCLVILKETDRVNRVGVWNLLNLMYIMYFLTVTLDM